MSQFMIIPWLITRLGVRLGPGFFVGLGAGLLFVWLSLGIGAGLFVGLVAWFFVGLGPGLNAGIKTVVELIKSF